MSWVRYALRGDGIIHLPALRKSDREAAEPRSLCRVTPRGVLARNMDWQGTDYMRVSRTTYNRRPGGQSRIVHKRQRQGLTVSRRHRGGDRLAAHHLSLLVLWMLLLTLAGYGAAELLSGAGGTKSSRQSVVLGSGDSLSDMVSGSYSRNSGVDVLPKKESSSASAAAKLSATQRSGLINAAPPPKAAIPFYAIFGNLADQTIILPPVIRSPLPRVAPAVNYYRTVCVRLCDGAFFPINYSTTSDRFDHDEEMCQKSCSAPAKLYVYKTLDGSPETMEDVEGRPYAKLTTAFQFRTAYDPSCTCKPHPWSDEAKALHRMYVLQDATKKGDKKAAIELELLKKVIKAKSAAMTSAASPARLAAAKPEVMSDGTQAPVTDTPLSAPVAEPPSGDDADAVQPADSEPLPAAAPKRSEVKPSAKPKAKFYARSAQSAKSGKVSRRASYGETADDHFRRNFGQ